MEFNLKYFAILAFVCAFIIVQESSAIKCWDCRSDADPKCSDPFDNATFSMTYCPSVKLDILQGETAKMCRKIRQKVHGVWRYIRSCAFLGEPGIQGDERYCLMRTGSYNIFMEYCTCNSKDGCNISSKINISPILIMSALTVIPYLNRNF